MEWKEDEDLKKVRLLFYDVEDQINVAGSVSAKNSADEYKELIKKRCFCNIDLDLKKIIDEIQKLYNQIEKISLQMKQWRV